MPLTISPETLDEAYRQRYAGMSEAVPSVAPRPVASPPALPPSTPEQQDAGFFAGAKAELGDYQKVLDYIVSHPGDVPEALYEGVKGALGYLVNTSTSEKKRDLAEFAHQIATHPRETLGRLAVDIPVGAVTGGVGGKVLSSVAKEGIKRAALGVAGGAAAASGGAGVRSRALTGEPASGQEAALAAALGGSFGGLTGGAHRVALNAAKTGVRKASNAVPGVFGRARDPVEYFESQALKHPDKTMRKIYGGAHKFLTTISYYGDKARKETADMLRPVRDAVKRVKGEDKDKLLRALQATDERWFQGEDKLAIPEKELTSKYGLSEAAVDAYWKILKAYHNAGQAYREAWLRAHPKASPDEAPQVKFGMLPHRWDAPHRVIVPAPLDVVARAVRPREAGAEVRAFISRDAALQHARETGGTYLDPRQNRYTVHDLDALLNQIDWRNTKDPIAALQRLERAAKPGSALHGMFGQRKGVRGYTSLRSVEDLVDAVDSTISTVNRARYNMKMAPVHGELRSVLKRAGSPMEVELLDSAYERHLGMRRATAPVRGAKRALMNTMLGASNFVVPLLNVIVTGVTTPAYLMWESRKLARLMGGGAGDEVGLARAIATTLKTIPAMLPPKVRKAFVDVYAPQVAERIRQNEAAGVTPDTETVALADVAGVGRSHLFKPGEHEKHPAVRAELNKRIDQAEKLNTWLLRHSEVAARRAVGAAAREVGERMGLTGAELDRWVHAVTESTVGRFNKGMRAAILEGEGNWTDALALGLTFQTWIWQKSIQLARMAQEHPKAAIAAMGTFVGLAGAEGVPIVVPVMDAAIDAVDPSGELRAEWEQFKLDHPALFHGALSQTPVDLSGRFALGLPLNAASEYAFNPWGMYDTFARLFEATKDEAVAAMYSEGPLAAVGAGGEQFAKSFLASGDLARRVGAWRALQNGGEYAPLQRGKYAPHEPISRAEALATLVVGGEPRSVAEKRRKTSAEALLSRSRRDRMASIRESYVRGRLSNAEAVRLIRATSPRMDARAIRLTLKRWQEAALRRNKAWQPRLSRYDRRLR